MAYMNRHAGRGSGPWLVYCDDHVPDGHGYPHELAAEWEAAKDAIAADSLERDGYPSTIPSTSTPRELIERLNDAGAAFNAHERYPWAPDTMMGNCVCEVCGRNFAASELQSFPWWDSRCPSYTPKHSRKIECHYGPALIGAREDD